MIWPIIIGLTCFLSKGLFERWISIRSGLLVAFFGLLLIGGTLLVNGSYSCFAAIVHNRILGTIMHLLVASFGAFILWVAAKPMLKLMISFMQKKKIP